MCAQCTSEDGEEDEVCWCFPSNTFAACLGRQNSDNGFFIRVVNSHEHKIVNWYGDRFDMIDSPLKSNRPTSVPLRCSMATFKKKLWPP